jgi:hypothetical protein
MIRYVAPYQKKGYNACSVSMHDELVISLPFLQKKRFILLLNYVQLPLSTTFRLREISVTEQEGTRLLDSFC